MRRSLTHADLPEVFFGTDGIFYGDFHGFQGTDRSITKLDPKTLDANIAYKLDEKIIVAIGKVSDG